MPSNNKHCNETCGLDNHSGSIVSNSNQHSCEDEKEIVWMRTQMYQGDLVTVIRYRCTVCGAEWTEAPWN